MTPKEKAIELIEQFSDIDNMGRFSDDNGFSVWGTEMLKQQCKQCALICVDEILLNFGNMVDGKPFYSAHNAIKFYQQVKQEIQNL